jgi:hypothetical protein
MTLAITHLIYLCLLLSPGIIAGAVVTWKVRSPWSLFITIGSSLAGSLVIMLTTMLFWQVAIKVLQVGKDYQAILYTPTPYLMVVPVGTVAGAALAGMLLLANYELKQAGRKFETFYAVVATLGTAVLGGFLSMLSTVLVAFIIGISWVFLTKIFPSVEIGLNTPFTVVSIFVLGLLLLNGVVFGMASALGGMKLAKFFV